MFLILEKSYFLQKLQKQFFMKLRTGGVLLCSFKPCKNLYNIHQYLLSLHRQTDMAIFSKKKCIFVFF